jgi:hypothetical protein
MDNTLRSGPQFARDHKQTYYTIYYYYYYYYYFMVEVMYVPPCAVGKVNNGDQILIRRILNVLLKVTFVQIFYTIYIPKSKSDKLLVFIQVNNSIIYLLAQLHIIA